MPDFATEIKKIVLDTIENEKLSDIVYATYNGSGLVLDGKPVPVDADMIDIPASLLTISGLLSMDISEGFEIVAKDGQGEEITIESIKLTDIPVTIKTGLTAGDRVAVIQKKGAQKYSIIDRV